jgi:hypothetical protein
MLINDSSPKRLKEVKGRRVLSNRGVPAQALWRAGAFGVSPSDGQRGLRRLSQLTGGHNEAVLAPIVGRDAATIVMTLSYYQNSSAPISRPVWGNIAHLLHDRFSFPNTDHKGRG